MPQFAAIDNLRKKLKTRTDLPLTGIIINTSDPMSTDALSDSCDWFFYDMEHKPFSPQLLRTHIMVAHGRNTPAIVRIPGPNLSYNNNILSPIYGTYIKHALDANADGIIIPQVRTSVEVKEIIKDCMYPYPPNKYTSNRRGFGPTIPSNYGRIPLKDYIPNANKKLFIGVNVETKECIENIYEIAAIHRLDFLIMGVNDLCGSYGVPYEVGYNAKIIEEAVDKVIDAAKRNGKIVIYSPIGGSDVGLAKKMINKGVEMMLVGSDVGAMVKYHTNLRNKIKSKL
eukprot:240487_1